MDAIAGEKLGEGGNEGIEAEGMQRSRGGAAGAARKHRWSRVVWREGGMRACVRACVRACENEPCVSRNALGISSLVRLNVERESDPILETPIEHHLNDCLVGRIPICVSCPAPPPAVDDRSDACFCNHSNVHVHNLRDCPAATSEMNAKPRRGSWMDCKGIARIQREGGGGS